MGCNSDDVQWRIYVRTEDRWAKEIRWEGVSQAGVEIVMTRQGIEWVAEQLLGYQEGLLSLTLIFNPCIDFDG